MPGRNGPEYARKIDSSLSIGSQSRFLEEMRAQLGYRIEQYGYKGLALRFIHPFYEEAFANIATKDHIASDVIANTIKSVSEDNLRACVNSILNNFRKYPSLSLTLIDSISYKFREVNLTEESQIGLKFIALFNEVRDPRIIECLYKLSDPLELTLKINKEADIVSIGYALRYAYNYKAKLDQEKLRTTKKISLSKKINWPLLFDKLKNETVYSKIITPLEWAILINSYYVKKFIESFTIEEIKMRFESFAITDQHRFLKIASGSLRNFLLDSVGKRSFYRMSKKERKNALFNKSPNNQGVVIDDGAASAIKHKSYSLLPVGIKYTVGDFEKDELVSIFNDNEDKIAAGVSKYSADDIQLIRGQHSRNIIKILGYNYGPVIKDKTISFPIEEKSNISFG